MIGYQFVYTVVDSRVIGCQFPEETKGQNLYHNELRFVFCSEFFLAVMLAYFDLISLCMCVCVCVCIVNCCSFSFKTVTVT